jgi:hypothetical protein
MSLIHYILKINLYILNPTKLYFHINMAALTKKKNPKIEFIANELH